MTAGQLRVTGVIPVYNHELAVPAVAANLRAQGLPVVLVDDGSNDSCRVALEKLAAETGDVLVRRAANGGKGAAVISGLRKAQQLGFTHALQVDADGQHDLRDVPKFLARAQAEPGAVICGRPVFDASIPRVRFLSRYITHALVWLQTLSFSAVRDSMCGFRLYPVSTVLEVVDRDGVGTRMDFDVELLVKLVWRGRTLRWIDTQVSYPKDGISHFRMLYDNLRLAGMHVRLVLGMLWRAPMLIWRRIRNA
ncbi:MAG TPA: glycosyltransferase family 2 protein [Steroidobacteraceae bacterium]|nr:glycosyltransferase family 2 protein [Steroidobacteraceae bacterium]